VLQHHEGVAAGARRNPLDQRRRDCRAAELARRQAGHRLLVQRPEPQLKADRVAQLGTQLPQRGQAGIVVAGGDQQQQRRARQIGDQVPQHVAAGRVQPLHIVQQQERAAVEACQLGPERGHGDRELPLVPSADAHCGESERRS
jgi:hypothetical protein